MIVRDALRTARTALESAGVDQPERDARLLVAMILGVPAALVDPSRKLTAAESAQLDGLVRRRAGREPIARIAGRREFWGLEFTVTAATLDPRPDSETVVSAALAARKGTPTRTVLDLGTGTGCLLCALLTELPAATGVGVDIALGVVTTARANAARLGLGTRAQFLLGSWLEPVRGRFDLVVANPPYISTATIATLEPEVAQFEPRAALDGGADGLSAYRAIIAELAPHLAPAATVVLEVGAGQAAAVSLLLTDAGLTVTEIARDLGDIERCVVAQAAP